MTIKHNQQIQHNHFRKDWQRRVRCHFDQPGRKLRRRNSRIVKAAAVAPRPVDKLRPIVRCPTIKYNRRVRAGRGFTLTELKEAGIQRKFARTIGISVDPRRQNLSVESLTLNVARLKSYRARLILFPRRAGIHDKADASPEELKTLKSGESNIVQRTTVALPIVNALSKADVYSEVKISEMGKTIEGGVYQKLRSVRNEARYKGIREKRAKAKADEKENAKK